MKSRGIVVGVGGVLGVCAAAAAQTGESVPMGGANGGSGHYSDTLRSRAEEEALVTSLRSACDGRQLDACTLLGTVLLRPQHVHPDPQRAAGLFSMACDGGVMTACGDLGIALVRGEIGDAPARAQGVALLRKGCDGGDGGSCVNLGALLATAGETPVHVAEGVRILRRTCERFPNACHQLGAVYLTGSGVPADVAAGVALYDRACTQGLAVSCGVLADLYGAGRAAPRDLKKAYGYLDRACKLGSQPACQMLASSKASH